MAKIQSGTSAKASAGGKASGASSSDYANVTDGAQEGTRTLTPYGTRPSNVCVYQFHHLSISKEERGLREIVWELSSTEICISGEVLSGADFSACGISQGSEIVRPMYVVWTTVPTKEEAERIAKASIENRLAACAQVDGPIRSFYQWEGKVEVGEEFRITFKVIEERLKDLEARVCTMHPYDTPQWIVMKAVHVAEKYLSWARANSSNPPL